MFFKGAEMLELIYDLYARLFARKIFNKFNKFIFLLGLRGLGVLNYKSDKQSGEANFVMSHFSNVKKGVIFDVGANVGNYSKSLREINRNMEIYCFEPHPRTFQKLLSTVGPLEIKTFNVGIGSADGKLKLYDYANNKGSEHASLYKDVIETIHQGKAVEHEVEIVTLNTFAIEHQIERVLLLKIDTEGHELEVLKGFEPYIRQNKVDLIHFEFNEMNVVSRVFFKDFWEFLPNYDFYRMMQDGLIPIKNYNPVYCEIFAYQNIVAKLKTELRQN
jgi:FkbM family methyltransferase